MMPPNSDRWVLVPGTLCTPEVFAPVLKQLGVPPERQQVIEVSSPRVEDYDAPLRGAIKGGEVVCGFSLGAMILAHNLGALAKAKAVVLFALNPFPDAANRRAGREATRDRVLAGDAAGWVNEHWATMSRDTGETVKAQVINMAEAMSGNIVAQTDLALSRPGAVEQLSAAVTPLVFITGAEDSLTPPDAIQPIAKACRHAGLYVLDGLGHFALLEAPDRVALAIADGLNSVPPKSKQEG